MEHEHGIVSVFRPFFLSDIRPVRDIILLHFDIDEKIDNRVKV